LIVSLTSDFSGFEQGFFILQINYSSGALSSASFHDIGSTSRLIYGQSRYVDMLLVFGSSEQFSYDSIDYNYSIAAGYLSFVNMTLPEVSGCETYSD